MEENLTKKCKSCKGEIDLKAIKCPHCGTDQRNWFRRHPILTVIAALIVIGIGGSAAGGKNEKAPQTLGTQSQATAQPTPQVVTIDAKELVGEYDKNKLAAQDKYTGRVVKTTADINNISSNITGSYYLSLNPSNDPYYFGTTIQCFFTDKNELTALAKGQQVTVQGTMKDMSFGTVVINDCSLVK